MSDERKQIKEMIHAEISAEVRRWVIEQPPERYNELPQDSREFVIFSALGILTNLHSEQLFVMNSALETITMSYLGSQVSLLLPNPAVV